MHDYKLAYKIGKFIKWFLKYFLQHSGWCIMGDKHLDTAYHYRRHVAAEQEQVMGRHYIMYTIKRYLSL